MYVMRSVWHEFCDVFYEVMVTFERLSVSYLAMLCMGMLPSMDYCHLGERLLDLKWHHYLVHPHVLTIVISNTCQCTTPSHV
jgi:hypothetical protein